MKYDHFQTQCLKLVKKSQWDMTETKGEKYLELLAETHVVVQDVLETTYWRIHVVFSHAYSCPVLYFRVSDSSGSPLLSASVVEKIEGATDPGLACSCSLMDHSILEIPYWQIHPCVVAVMELDLVSFLSVMRRVLGDVGVFLLPRALDLESVL